MIDICTVVHKNYQLLDWQVEHWKKIKGDHRLLVVDNTPPELRQQITQPVTVFEPDNWFDGVSHGQALDALARLATTDIVGFVDTDFFWLRENIIQGVEILFDAGFRAVGCAGFYPDWQRVLDPKHPDRAGHLAPVVWGMFVDRKLALQETFVCTPQEGAEVRETGWRLRKRLIDDKIPTVVFQGGWPEGWTDKECCFFYNKGQPVGVHFLKGSGFRTGHTDRIPSILQTYFN